MILYNIYVTVRKLRYFEIQIKNGLIYLKLYFFSVKFKLTLNSSYSGYSISGFSRI